MALIIIPFRGAVGKSRLRPLREEARFALAHAMLADVRNACATVAETVVATRPGGQGAAVADALQGIDGPVAIVNADLPCITPGDVEALLTAAHALVAARDGTTNAIALLRASDFRALYGPGSAERFAAHGLEALRLPNLVDDVDTVADLERVADRVGPSTRAVLESLRVTT
jgi:2-phospho-L-lactate guanylyltransferase (CobY/MobA/RfbA family)